MYRMVKPIIFILAVIIAAILYSEISFTDVRNDSLIYFAYGIDTNQNTVAILRWYFSVCLLISYFFGCFKKNISNNRLNRIVRYSSKKVYSIKILLEIISKSIMCWIFILATMSILKFDNFSFQLNFESTIVFIASTLAIILLITLYTLLDSMITSIYAFIIVNGCIVVSIALSNIIESPIIKCMLFPNLLMGIQLNENTIVLGIIAGVILEIILILIYLKIIEKKDILIDDK